MFEPADAIVRVRAESIVHHLSQPVRFGEWLMAYREFILVRVDSRAARRALPDP